MSEDKRTRRRVLGHPFGYALGAWLAFSLLAAGDDAPPTAPGPPPPPPELMVGALPFRTVTVNVGNARVGSWGPWTAESRKGQRGGPLWQLYMHGVVDFFAAPVPWEALLGEGQDAARWLDSSALLNTNIRKSTLSAVKLAAGESLALGNPLPLPGNLTSADSVRVFVWMTAREATGGSAPPALDIVVRDTAGNTLATHPGPMRAGGTFGWHCYYLDVPLGTVAPTAASVAGGELLAGAAAAPAPGKLHARLANPTTGTVWFSTLSWELLGSPGTVYAPEDKQDPATGSLASFPAIDDLTTHLLAGQAYAHPWNFFRGKEGGARNLPDLTSPEAIRAYLAEARETDPSGSLGGAVFLGPWLYAAAQYPGKLDLSPEWHAAFRETLLSFQDAGTGFWGTSLSSRCMATTTRMVEAFWGGEPMSRGGFEVPARPWLGYGGKSVPGAKAMVETVLGARSRRQAGGADVGAWGTLAYEWQGDGEGEEEICSLATTRNAFVLLRLAGASLSDADRARIERALAAAWHGVFRLCVLEDGLWKLAARDTEPTSPAFLPRILDLAPWLEERTDRTLPAPKVLAKAGEGRSLEFTWSEPENGVVSVRIFAAPKTLALGRVRLAHLVGIIERDGTTVWSMDPVHAAGFIRDAARKRWAVDIGAGPDVPLLADRLAIFDKLTGMAAEANPLVLSLAQANDLAFYAVSVNGQGEQSLLVPIEVPLLAAPAVAPPPEPTEKPAEPAEQDPFAAPAEQDPFAAPAEQPAAAPAEPDPFADPAP